MDLGSVNRTGAGIKQIAGGAARRVAFGNPVAGRNRAGYPRPTKAVRPLLAVFRCLPQLPAGESPADPPPIRRIYLTHFSHTDFGFTDLQSVCRELQGRYLDIALDAMLATMDGSPERRFCWGAESLVAVNDWWR